MRRVRALRLTAKGRAVLGVPEPPVMVPLLNVVWRDDERDRRVR